MNTLATTSVAPLYAGFWRRAAAASLDWLVLLIPNSIINQAISDRVAQLLVYIIVGCGYYAGFHSSNSQAILGKRAFGIKVTDLERSVRFYELLGFTKTAGPIGPEPVAILDHPSGVEVNLVLNAPNANEPNVLMDVPEKHPGITHFALLCPDIMAAKERLEAAGVPLSGGPVRFGPGAQGIFLRDPDRNVIELHQRG